MAADGSNPSGSSSAVGSLPPDGVIFGRSAAMSLVRQKADKVAGTNVPVLIEGEGGTGKELLARWIHAHSSWSSGPFVKVNCAAIPEALLESELFGYEKGAFTGAYNRKPGRVELADGGTLFLDEIAEINQRLQAKLLQFLQDGRFSRIGAQEELRVETRVICSTGRKLETEIENGKFRADLFYRINVIRVRMPSLRDRREDVLQLADYFLSHFSSQFELPAPRISEDLIHVLQNREWRGNIRELANGIARYVILGGEGLLEETLGSSRSAPLAGEMTAADVPIPLKRIAKRAVLEMERRLILSVLEVNRWNRRKTAEALKISYRALIYKIREAGLSPKNNRNGKQSKDPQNRVAGID